MNTIDKLVSNEGWNIQSWRFRYGTELWVIASPLAEQLDQIREITEGADIEAIELASYFNNEGSWLPVISAKNISEGLEMLEQKIKVFENIEEWKQKVVGTFSRIIEVNDGGYGLSIAVNEKKESIFFAPDGLNNPFFMRTYFVLIEEVEKVETAAYKDRLGIIERLIIEGRAVEPSLEDSKKEYGIAEFHLRYSNNAKYTAIKLQTR